EIIPQVQPNPGMPERKAVGRHRQRVLELLPSLPENAQRAIRQSMENEDQAHAAARRRAVAFDDDSPTEVIDSLV
ncbi:ABC transporter ATP-binding protein, partial [Gordonia sp. N1V]|nr:ABC transporter ATP-binding protein [Gordonia sp. N1V]